MTKISIDLLDDIRGQFSQIDTCPVQGSRIFFENAGGALTLNKVVETSAAFAAVPDNQGRDNPGSHELMRVIDKAKQDLRIFMNARYIFAGRSHRSSLYLLIDICIIRFCSCYSILQHHDNPHILLDCNNSPSCLYLFQLLNYFWL